MERAVAHLRLGVHPDILEAQQVLDHVDVAKVAGDVEGGVALFGLLVVEGSVLNLENSFLVTKLVVREVHKAMCCMKKGRTLMMKLSV